MKLRLFLLALFLMTAACSDSESSNNANSANNQNNTNNTVDERWFFQVDGGDRYAGTTASKQQRPQDTGIQLTSTSGSILMFINAQVGDLGTFPAHTVQFSLVDTLDNCGWTDDGTGTSPASVTLTQGTGTGITGTFTITDLECTEPAGLLLNGNGGFETF